MTAALMEELKTIQAIKEEVLVLDGKRFFCRWDDTRVNQSWIEANNGLVDMETRFMTDTGGVLVQMHPFDPNILPILIGEVRDRSFLEE